MPIHVNKTKYISLPFHFIVVEISENLCFLKNFSLKQLHVTGIYSWYVIKTMKTCLIKCVIVYGIKMSFIISISCVRTFASYVHVSSFL